MKPTKRLLTWVGIWFLLSLGFTFGGAMETTASSGWLISLVYFSKTLWSIFGGTLIFLAFLDARKRKEQSSIVLERITPGNLSLGIWHTIELRVKHAFAQKTHIIVFDHYPLSCEVEHLPQKLVLVPGQSNRIRYRLRPTLRGTMRFQKAQLFLPSSIGFWHHKIACGNSEEIKVFPNFAAIGRFRMLAVDNRTKQVGIKVQQRRGEGLEFHQLRQYREGDTIRQIHWKSSVRRQKLISKEYQNERDQQIIIMLDCGRKVGKMFSCFQ